MSDESNTKLSRLSKYDVILMVENTTEDNVRDTEHTLPTDVHLVTYADGDDIKWNQFVLTKWLTSLTVILI